MLELIAEAQGAGVRLAAGPALRKWVSANTYICIATEGLGRQTDVSRMSSRFVTPQRKGRSSALRATRTAPASLSAIERPMRPNPSLNQINASIRESRVLDTFHRRGRGGSE